jgi:selenocysteine lyase/cysteine desulfurase
MESSLAQWRMDTPGVAHCIHLNNAGAALMPQVVIDAMQQHLQLEATIGGYEAEAAAQAQIEGFYSEVAQLLQCDARHIAYTSSATDAYNRALSAIPFQAGDTIVTTNNDYASNQIAFLQMQKRFGLRLLRAADLPEGGVDPDSVRALVKQYRPALVAVTHVPTNSGLVQDVAAIGQICAEIDTWYLVDACQSVGQLPIAVSEIQCDFLSATFRKFLRGPRGAGFLYVSDEALNAGLEPLFLDLLSANWTTPAAYVPHRDAHRFELWERPHALMLGSKAATTYALQVGISAIAQRVQYLADFCRSQLSALPGVRNLDQGTLRCGITSYTIDHAHPDALKAMLAQQHINVTIPRWNNAVIDFTAKNVTWALRVSPHYYNTEAEIEMLVEALRSMLAGAYSV